MPQGLVTGSILGLVSFLLAFSFGIAASNFTERRSVIIEEANAVGTAYLRADILPEEGARDRLRSLLRSYTEVRVAASNDNLSVAEFKAIVENSERLHGEMWALVSGIARETPSPVTALVVGAVNDVIDLHTMRVAAGVRHTIPGIIWLALYAISAVALATTGYRFGSIKSARSELLPSMVFAFSCVITLIADLDDPRSGFLLSDQTPMLDLLNTMEEPGA